jgi:CBS domain-containing protein
MARIQDVMTPDPVTLPDSATVQQAAQAMREADIGDVIVMHDGDVAGIVTDRDLVVRSVADGQDPTSVRVGTIASPEIVALSPDDDVDRAIELMRVRAVRRLPVVDQDKPVGIVSLGDLARLRDQDSALADISDAPPNT